MKRLLVALALSLGLAVLATAFAKPAYAASNADPPQFILDITTVPEVIDTGPGVVVQSNTAAIATGPPIVSTAIDTSPPASEPSSANYYSGNVANTTASSRAPDQPDHPASAYILSEQIAKKT